MMKADDEISFYASGGSSEKMSFRPESYEEPQNVSHEAGGKSELEQMLKRMTFTRSEAQHFISLLHSRIIEEEECDNIHASVVTSRVFEEEIASPVELAPRQDLKLINNNNNNATSTCLSISSVALPKHPTTLETLPEEVLTNIFIRLLAKQLAQMRSVNKSWNALLSQSSFVKSHLTRSIHNNDQTLLLFHDEEFLFSNYKPFTVKLTRSPCLELANFIKLPVNPQPECINCITVIGSVNGLICSRYGDSIIQIWNPSLSAVLTLPPYSTPSRSDFRIRIHFRFGFDPKTDDYKVVKLTGLTGHPGPYPNAIKRWLQVEVYSMRKGCWDLITGRFHSHIPFLFDGDSVCVDGHDGHLHWLGCNFDCISNDLDSFRILAFDLGSETFREIPLPYSTLDDNHCSIVFGILAKKLCVMSCTSQDDAYEVWVMEEYGVAESWVKRHVFSLFIGDDTRLFGFTSQGLFLTGNAGYIALYDPFTNERKVLLEVQCPEKRGVHNIVEYVDSLVWVTHI